MQEDIFDIVIIGGGPAGLTAALYAKRAMLNIVVIEKFCVGGQLNLTDMIENYPGFSQGLSTQQLVEEIEKQVGSLGVNIVHDEALSIEKIYSGEKACYKVRLKSNKEYNTYGLIIATGANPRKLGVAGEEKFKGRGISYCAVCDGPLYRNKDVVVAGGGDRATEEALYLAKMCKKVTLVHRRDQLRAVKILQDRIRSNKKICLELEEVVMEIAGDSQVKSIVLKNTKTQCQKSIYADGIFIAIGMDPNTGFLKGLVDMDEAGYIKTDEDLETSCKGIFACGDVRAKKLRQVITACGDGALASFTCGNYLERLGV